MFVTVNCRVDVSFYENLVGMGYGKGAAAAALRQTNNDLNQALEVNQYHGCKEILGSKGQFRIKYPSIFLYKCELLYFKACIYYENY